MADQVVSKLIEVVKKKNKAGVVVKPFQVRKLFYICVFAFARFVKSHVLCLLACCLLTGEEPHVAVC